jgi:hypothetical protein
MDLALNPMQKTVFRKQTAVAVEAGQLYFQTMKILVVQAVAYFQTENWFRFVDSAEQVGLQTTMRLAEAESGWTQIEMIQADFAD